MHQLSHYSNAGWKEAVRQIDWSFDIWQNANGVIVGFVTTFFHVNLLRRQWNGL